MRQSWCFETWFGWLIGGADVGNCKQEQQLFTADLRQDLPWKLVVLEQTVSESWLGETSQLR